MLSNDPGNILIQSATEMYRSRELMRTVDDRVESAINAAKNKDFDPLKKITASEERLIRIIRSRLAISLKELHAMRTADLAVEADQNLAFVENIIIASQQYLDLRQNRIDTQKILLADPSEKSFYLYHKALNKDCSEQVGLLKRFNSFREELLGQYRKSRTVISGTSGLAGLIGSGGLFTSGITFWYMSVVATLAISSALVSFAYFDNRIRAVQGDERALAIIKRERGQRLEEIKQLLRNLAQGK